MIWRSVSGSKGICYVQLGNLSNSGIGWPSESKNSILGWVKTMEYYAISELFICCGRQYYAGAALGSFASIVLARTVHSSVLTIAYKLILKLLCTTYSHILQHLLRSQS
jgi:hypothetical protein